MVYCQSENASSERAKALSSMADFYFTAGNYDKAIELEKQAMNMTGVLYGNRSFDYSSLALTIAKYYYSKGRFDLSSSESVKEQSLSEAIKNLRITMDVIKDSMLVNYDKIDSKEKYELWQQVCPLFDRLFPGYVAYYQTDSTTSELYNVVLFSKGITWRNYEEAQKADWREVQRKLKSDEIAIEFISLVDLDEENIQFYALTLKKECKAPHMIKLFDIQQLHDVFKTTPIDERDLEMGKLIWGTLKNDLKGVKNIYFSATHFLHQFPIEFLPIDDNYYYFDFYNFYRLSSTISLVSDRKRYHYNRAVLYGGLDYESQELSNGKSTPKTRAGVEPLDNSKPEIDEISELLKNNGVQCDVYSGLSGTERTLRNLSGQSFDILHLSTHGKYVTFADSLKYISEDDVLLNSYITLSGANMRLKDTSINVKDDGIVSAYDISRMVFKTLDLVCLSVCESALGVYSDDDGMIGLQKGFKLAGANTIIMSLDEVDDEATKNFMVEFYKNLMNGKTKHQSFVDAQKSLRQIENGKFNKPKYWASFIMLDGLN